MNRQPIVFKTKHIPRFSEIDPYGHVNTQHYLAYFLEHRFIGMRDQLGLSIKEVSKLPVAFVVRKISLEFLRPLFSDQTFEITSQVTSFANTSCEVSGVMVNEKQDKLATCDWTLVCVDMKTMRPVAWPQDIIDRFYVSC